MTQTVIQEPAWPAPPYIGGRGDDDEDEKEDDHSDNDNDPNSDTGACALA